MYGNALYGYAWGAATRLKLLYGAYVGQAYGGSRGPAGSTGAMAGMPFSGIGSGPPPKPGGGPPAKPGIGPPGIGAAYGEPGPGTGPTPPSNCPPVRWTGAPAACRLLS